MGQERKVDKLNKKVLEEIREAIDSGPSFAQSHFQTSSFVISNHQGEARSYRQTLLALNEKITALHKAEIGVRRTELEIKKLKAKMEIERDSNERGIIQCDIEDKELDLGTTKKLVMDAIGDCNHLYAVFKSFPKGITNEQFEKEEHEYWKKRLSLEAELSILATGRIDTGTAMSLLNIGVNPVQAQLQLEKDLKLLEKK
jgi:hypothetical protein